MIFAENNIDIYSEKLDRVVQKTDFNSNLKHNSQNVYSIFNSFISLNFSKKVFEVIHFIKFLILKLILEFILLELITLQVMDIMSTLLLLIVIGIMYPLHKYLILMQMIT